MAEIEVTDEMINEASLVNYSVCTSGLDAEDFVAIYRTMFALDPEVKRLKALADMAKPLG